MNKIGQLSIRNTARSNRNNKTEAHRTILGEQVYRKLHLRGEKRVVGLEKVRGEYSRSCEEFGVHVPTLAAFKEQMINLKTKIAKKEVMESVYNAVVYGWVNRKYKCAASGKTVCTLCKMSGGKDGWAPDGHMERHCTLLLEMIEAGEIKKPDAAPSVVAMTIRGFGDYSLGKRTGVANDTRTAKRAKMHQTFMASALSDSSEHSPVIRIEEFTQGLVGRKIEIRLMQQAVVGPAFLWCFEGTITQLLEETESKQPKLTLKSQHSVVRVKWDETFDMHPSDHALDPRKCLSETAHGGWNLLRESYAAMQEELAIEDARTIANQETQALRV